MSQVDVPTTPERVPPSERHAFTRLRYKFSDAYYTISIPALGHDELEELEGFAKRAIYVAENFDKYTTEMLVTAIRVKAAALAKWYMYDRKPRTEYDSEEGTWTVKFFNEDAVLFEEVFDQEPNVCYPRVVYSLCSPRNGAVLPLRKLRNL